MSDTIKDTAAEHSARWKPLAPAALAIGAAYFIFLMQWYQPAISTMDAHGYHNQAKLIATTGKTYMYPENDIQYVGFTWRKHPNGDKYYALHPAGFPLMLAPVWRLLGAEAALLENPIMAALNVALLFLLCAGWFGPAPGLLAAAIFASFPFVNMHALYGYAHTAAVFLALCSLCCIDIWRRTGSALAALAAGLLIGYIPAVRLMETLLIPGVVVFAILEVGVSRRSIKSFALFFIGIIIPVAGLALYNHNSFGAFWETGYSMIFFKPQQFIGPRNFIANWRGFLHQLVFDGGGPAFCLGAPAIVAMCFSRAHRNRGILLFLLAFPLTLAYVSYYPGPQLQSMRFLIPTFPLYAAGCAWLASLAKNRSAGITFCVALAAFSAAWGIPRSIEKMSALEQKNRVLVDLKEELYKYVPDGSIIISNEAVDQYLDYLGRWKLVCSSERNRSAMNLDGIFQMRNINERFNEELDKWAEGRKIFWVLSVKNAERIKKNFEANPELKYVATVNIGDTIWRSEDSRNAIEGAESNPAAAKMNGPERRVKIDESMGGMIDRQFLRLMSNRAIVILEWTQRPGARRALDYGAPSSR